MAGGAFREGYLRGPQSFFGTRSNFPFFSVKTGGLGATACSRAAESQFMEQIRLIFSFSRIVDTPGLEPEGQLCALRAVGGSHEFEGAADIRFQLLAMYDGIEHAVFQEELATLETLGQLLPNGLLNDTRAGESN